MVFVVPALLVLLAGCGGGNDEGLTEELVLKDDSGEELLRYTASGQS